MNPLLLFLLQVFQQHASVGTATASFYPGWGTLTWGENGWGTITEAVRFQLRGVSATSSVGAITPADVMGLTGLSATASVGTPTMVDQDVSFAITGLSATSSVGSIILKLECLSQGFQRLLLMERQSIRSYNTTTLTGLSATSSVGASYYFIKPIGSACTGLSATSSLGTVVTEIGVPV